MTLLSDARRTYADLAKTERDKYLLEVKTSLATRVDNLQMDERIVLNLFYVEELSCEEVALVMGRTVEDVWLIRISALRKL